MTLPDTLVLATGNAHKIREIGEILRGLPVKLRSVSEFKNIPAVVEDAPDFKGNALKKADAIMRATGFAALADDSGLEVDALNGEPGVRSARYSGGGDADNNRLLLERLTNVPEERRTARFRCVIALCVPGQAPVFSEGKVEGRIGFAPGGAGGFGYDPLFRADGFSMTFAEMEAEAKNAISHRGRALRELRTLLFV